MSLLRIGSALVCAASLSACAWSRPAQTGNLSTVGTPYTTALSYTDRGSENAGRQFPLYQSFLPASRSLLAGRTLAVAEVSDIALRDKEVVLTFDDGPMPGKTPKILKALDDAGVGATFLMVGQMARAYPEIARQVAAEGHTVGTHTERHANLRTMSTESALAEIRRGEASITAALGEKPAPFFRFPYLADTKALRARLAGQGVVAIDVDIDSKDYFKDGPSRVMSRTLASIEKKGKGVILFHDIQARTVAMLPGFLKELERRGYKVVDLKPARDMLLASR
ncbi:polysaccharide deacetylase family protein [Fulvimarina sp. MAC8]|uniref:polysaccharide deacetylase family protein n=1 Tax=Fulvimarina sp. MAC8 TaxID=3162874 RepID=UPI0032ECE77A